MQTYQFTTNRLSQFDLTQLLENLPGVCDPDFDAVTEELERQFQEIRFSCEQV